MVKATSVFRGFLTIATVTLIAMPASAQQLDEWDAVRIALGENPSQQATELETDAARESLEAAEHEYVPVFRAGVGGGYDNSFGASALGIAPDHDGSVDVDLGIGWTSPVGTALDFEVAGSWADRDANSDFGESNVDSFSSSYGLDARLRLTQPLLRGAGRDVGESGERSARLSLTAAEHSQDAATSNLVSDVLSAYWELWYVQESLAVNRDALELAQRQLDEAEIQVNELGTMARVDSLRFASELATIEEELAQSQSDLRVRAIELGRLLGMDPEEAVGLGTADAPPAYDVDMTLDDALELARNQSSELLAAEADVAAAQDRIQVARDATLPRLDLTATLAVGGMWNDSSAADGYQPGGEPGITGLVGLSLELPIGNSRARAALAETRIRAEAAELRFEARERQVETETVTSIERLETARNQVELARQSVSIARELAEAEQEALLIGTTTTYQVLESQASLRRTELRLLRALVDQTKAAITLQHLTGQLLVDTAAHTGTL